MKIIETRRRTMWRALVWVICFMGIFVIAISAAITVEIAFEEPYDPNEIQPPIFYKDPLSGRRYLPGLPIGNLTLTEEVHYWWMAYTWLGELAVDWGTRLRDGQGLSGFPAVPNYSPYEDDKDTIDGLDPRFFVYSFSPSETRHILEVQWRIKRVRCIFDRDACWVDANAHSYK